jgi:hypothetical protein
MSKLRYDLRSVSQSVLVSNLICFLKIFKNSVRTSQETCYVSATKSNRLMLFREELAVYCDNHMEHNNTLCGQNAEF